MGHECNACVFNVLETVSLVSKVLEIGCLGIACLNFWEVVCSSAKAQLSTVALSGPLAWRFSLRLGSIVALKQRCQTSINSLSVYYLVLKLDLRHRQWLSSINGTIL